MTNYVRVLPRDLFNEADLLKCLGRLWILLDSNRRHDAQIVEEEVDAFDIVQDENSGAIEVRNLTFTIRGVKHRLVRPLNSRSAWPLWVEAESPESDFDAVLVFNEKGDLSDDMIALIGMQSD